MSKIYIYRGLPGSGKTTAARKLVETSPETIVRINNDDIRNMFGPYKVVDREPLVAAVRCASVTEALSMNYDVVVDNMNLDKEAIDELCDLAYVMGADFEIVDFDTPIEECIRRDALRPHPLGEKKIREIAEKGGISW